MQKQVAVRLLPVLPQCAAGDELHVSLELDFIQRHSREYVCLRPVQILRDLVVHGKDVPLLEGNARIKVHQQAERLEHVRVALEQPVEDEAIY